MKDYCVIFHSNVDGPKRMATDAVLNGTLDTRLRGDGEIISYKDKTSSTDGSAAHIADVKPTAEMDRTDGGSNPQQEDKPDQTGYSEHEKSDIEGDEGVTSVKCVDEPLSDVIDMQHVEAVLRACAKILRIVRHVILCIVSYIVSTLRASLAFMTGLVSFSLTLCLLSWYRGVLETDEKQNDVITKLVYIIRENIWSMLPVVIALPLSCNISGTYKTLLRRCYDHVIVMFVNSVIMATYLDMTSLHVMANIILASSLFRLINWSSRTIGCSFIGRATVSIPPITAFLVILYNFYHVMSQGWTLPSRDAQENTVSDVLDTDGDRDNTQLSDSTHWLIWMAAPLTALLGTNLRYMF